MGCISGTFLGFGGVFFFGVYFYLFLSSQNSSGSFDITFSGLVGAISLFTFSNGAPSHFRTLLKRFECKDAFGINKVFMEAFV